MYLVLRHFCYRYEWYLLRKGVLLHFLTIRLVIFTLWLIYKGVKLHKSLELSHIKIPEYHKVLGSFDLG